MNTASPASLSKPSLLRQPQTWIVVCLAAAYAVYFSWLTAARHQAFQTQAFDMAIFVQAFWNGLEGGLFRVTAHPGVTSFWQIHFAPSMLLIEPLYALFPAPQTLLILQSVFVASGAWPVYRLAVQRINHRGLGNVFALVYLLFPALQAANLYDFHLLTLAAPMLAWTIWLAENKQWRLYALIFGVSLGLREEVSIVLLGYGLLLLTRRETRRAGLLSSLAALSWMLVLYAVQFSGGSVLSSHFANRFQLGATPWQALQTLAANPLILWQRISDPARLLYLANLFAPVAYLAFFSPRFIFLVLPTLSLHLLSTFAPFHSAAQAHYNALLAPMIVISAVDGLPNLLEILRKARPRLHWAALFSLLLVGLSLGYQLRLAHLPFSPYFHAPQVLPRHAAVRELIRQIPPEASLSAQDNLAPHAANRLQLYIFPELGDAEFVLLDNQVIEVRLSAGLPAWRQVQQALQTNPEYSLVKEQDGYELYRRRAGKPLNDQAGKSNWQADLARPRSAALIALGMMLLFVLLMLAANGWDAKIFIFEGSLYSRSEPNGTIGYDGQFAYYIALDPLHAAPKIDEPAYRYQRILYPALAWLLSLGGNPVLLPWVLVLINILALTAAVYLLAEYLGEQSVSPLYAISFLAFIGTILTLWADLNEPLALALSLWGLRFVRRNQIWQAGLAFALGILAKEIALMFALGAAAWCLITRRFTHAAGLIALSLAPAVSWGLLLTRWLGQSPLQAEPASMELIPFYGLLFVLRQPVTLFIIIWAAVPAFLAGLVGLRDWRRWSAGPEALTLLANAALITLMPRLTWINIAGALRLSLGLLAASLFFTARYYPTRLKWVSLFWAASGPALLLLSPWLF